jgi:hypothetical protein
VGAGRQASSNLCMHQQLVGHQARCAISSGLTAIVCAELRAGPSSGVEGVEGGGH